jgi:hypothetical protein
MIDWQMCCLKLQNNYKPLCTVAKEIGCNWQHINRLARGETQQPRFDTGIALLDLAYDVLPENDFKELLI